ncbi:MAG: hypothetical protein IJV39_03380 [Ruminococcus sp.]|nr:hypothetical protein [Ruminococcus sp.]
MELIGELFIEIVGCIAEIIGQTLAESINDNLQDKYTFKRITIAVIVGILTWALIIALGFATYVLFAKSHPVAGLFVAGGAIFFLVLFISVIIKLNQIKRKK